MVVLHLFFSRLLDILPTSCFGGVYNTDVLEILETEGRS